MADYNSDEERFTAIVDFLKRKQKSIMLTFSLVLFVAISSITFSTYRDNQNAQAAELYNVWFVGVAEEASDLKKNFFVV